MQKGKGVTLETHRNLGFEPNPIQLQSSQQASCGWAAPIRTAVLTPQDSLPYGLWRPQSLEGSGAGYWGQFSHSSLLYP